MIVAPVENTHASPVAAGAVTAIVVGAALALFLPRLGWKLVLWAVGALAAIAFLKALF
ncbi:hypothetical protein EDD75_2221 [Thermodesulfitimonas autotrophica]|uniref:Major facilitator superfamily (MFS) profile domain-containing protein n=1 Tax=Thermodesulfitimonas autotrophica TaxID=1894989 RepID=A0A3N5ADD8_9THEO|nr:hypothetical protein EDD75_2221 [Thermodesulfitimonas autotrophica]